MGIDPGDRRIGIALSDPSGTICKPFQVLKHVARKIDAAIIAQIAAEQEVGKIIIGMALDSDGETGPQARKAIRLAEAIREQTSIPVVMWDETNSTRIAREIQILSGSTAKKRKAPIDALAAVMILQSYLEYLENDRSEA